MTDIVSRETAPEAPPAQPLERVFRTWRVMLTRGASFAARLGYTIGTSVGGLALSVHVVSQARSGAEPARRRLLMIAAVAAVVAGTMLGAVFASNESLIRAMATALIPAAWVVARYPAMRIAASRTTDESAHAVSRAWATGALLHVASITPELRFVTWAGGMALSWRTLRAEGYAARDAWSVCGVGYGLEAVGFILLVLLRSLRVAVLLVAGAS